MPQPFALIIEDDPKLGRIFSVALQQIGFQTELDEDGTHYKTQLESQTPDLVLLDVHLPFASGADILALIRADERWKNIPVVVMTADIAKSKSLEHLADFSLLKPVSVGHIQAIGAQILAKLSPN
jgi:DNA-binding response OmpR family regulator